MNHPHFSRPVRVLLAVALLGAGAHAFALDPAPPSVNVVIVDETERGFQKGILDRHGIASRSSNINRGPHAEALRQALGDENVRLRLATPTGCPTLSTREPCASVRKVKDVELPNVIAETKNSTLLILWPEAAYFPGEQLYLAYLDVDVLQKGKVVPGTFYVGYRDWECDTACVPAAFEASAKELAAMVRYMLEMGPAAQSKAIPADWLSKPVVTSVDKWANNCAVKMNKDRVVREYGERFWLNDPTTRTLTSTAWRGCNIFAAR
ncbi:MAG TPA: hypothetical protein VH814_22360 [Steroidobacteraceae bacterium]|jgi:hypothetical protein